MPDFCGYVCGGGVGVVVAAEVPSPKFQAYDEAVFVVADKVHVKRLQLGVKLASTSGVDPPGSAVTTNRSRFGEPETPVKTFFVEPLIRAAATAAGVGVVVWALTNTAAAPVTCGVAIDGPLIVFIAVALVFHADVMLTPGALMSTHEP